MAPKRKAPDDEHPHVSVGKARIRKRANGKRIADKDIRKNVLLYLENLKDEDAKDYSKGGFQNKLSDAVSSAMDPVVGPEAFFDLSAYHVDLPEAFGNKEAGQMMTKLLPRNDDGIVVELRKAFDEQKNKLQEEQTKREKVEKTLAYLQELIPLCKDGQKDLPKELEKLEALDPTGDSAWLYYILWTASLQWMDARLRQLRMFVTHAANEPKLPEPPGINERQQKINMRVHGGDLRADAIMSNIKFGEYRHHDIHYDVFIKEAFKKMYHLSVDDGLWLAKNGLEISGGMDWPRVIGAIDKFVALADRVCTWNWGTPTDYKDVIKNQFVPFTGHISNLIKQAKETPGWHVSDVDFQTLGTLYTALYQAVYKWKQGKRGVLPEWDEMGKEKNPWPHARYLRDEKTTQPALLRTCQGTSTKMLRPRVRINYKE